jgi:segregation and condensation protein B
MTLDALLEAVLFAAARPLKTKQLVEITQSDTDAVTSALGELRERLEKATSGVMLQENGHEFELVTRPEATDAVAKVVNAELQGELTRPALEALTVLAYCGPMTRPELEQLRGVQSSLILRNLMLRGLIEQKEESKLGQPTYAVTFDFLNHLGIDTVASLPSYDEMRGHSAVADALAQLEEEKIPKQNASEQSLSI